MATQINRGILFLLAKGTALPPKRPSQDLEEQGRPKQVADTTLGILLGIWIPTVKSTS